MTRLAGRNGRTWDRTRERSQVAVRPCDNRSVTDDEPYTLCPLCHKRVEPHDPGVVYAVERKEDVTIGPTYRLGDEMGGWFHAGCPPEQAGFERRPYTGNVP